MKCSDIINKRIVSNYLHLIFDRPYVILSAIFVLDIACCITQRNMHYLEMIGNDGLINAMCKMVTAKNKYESNIFIIVMLYRVLETKYYKIYNIFVL